MIVPPIFYWSRGQPQANRKRDEGAESEDYQTRNLKSGLDLLSDPAMRSHGLIVPRSRPRASPMRTFASVEIA